MPQQLIDDRQAKATAGPEARVGMPKIVKANAVEASAPQAEQTVAEQGDAEARGHSQAAQAAAQRLEQLATARAQTVRQRLAARRERNAAVAAIRREVFSRAFAELGIRLQTSSDAPAARPVQADDLATDIGSEDTQPDMPAPAAQANTATTEVAAPADGAPAAVAAGVVIMLRPDAGVLDDQIAERQPIPMKWRRFRLQLGEFRFDCHDDASRAAASAAFAARVLEQARAALGSWIESAEPILFVRIDDVDFIFHGIPSTHEFLVASNNAPTWRGVRLKPIAPVVLAWARALRSADRS